MICISVGKRSQLADIELLKVDFIELRLDLIQGDPEELFSLLPDDLSIIATCRPGVYSESQRASLLKECINLGSSFIDIEIESSASYVDELSSFASLKGSGVIVSYHNFQQTPDPAELQRILKTCYAMGGNIAKIATQVNDQQDIRKLLSLFEVEGRKVVVGMGSMGRITRIMSPYLGAEFTFASISREGETAPGQLTVTQLKEIYNMIDVS